MSLIHRSSRKKWQKRKGMRKRAKIIGRVHAVQMAVQKRETENCSKLLKDWCTALAIDNSKLCGRSA